MAILNLEPDPLASTLSALGCALSEYRLTSAPNSLYIGLRVRIQQYELIYRRPDESGWLLIVLYQRLRSRDRTLINPFGELLWFLWLCTEPRFQLKRILCHISTTPYRDRGGLDDARMIRFCRHMLDADWVNYDGHSWLYRDVIPLRARLAELRPRVPQLRFQQTDGPTLVF